MACCRNYRVVPPTLRPGHDRRHRFPSVRDKVLAVEQVVGPLPCNIPFLSTIRALPKCSSYGGTPCGYSTARLTPFEVFWNLFALPLIPAVRTRCWRLRSEQGALVVIQIAFDVPITIAAPLTDVCRVLVTSPKGDTFCCQALSEIQMKLSPAT